MRTLVLAVAISCCPLMLAAQEPTATSSAPTSLPAATPDTVLKAMGKPFAPAVDELPSGKVDWTHGEVVAYGVGKARNKNANEVLMAKRAAALVAARNSLLLMSGLKVDASGRFGLRTGTVTAEGVVEQYETTYAEPTADGTVLATMRLPLYGARGFVKVAKPTGNGAARFAPKADAATTADVLIIDARGTKFTPCLCPRVVTDKGEIIVNGVATGDELGADGKDVNNVHSRVVYSVVTTKTEGGDAKPGKDPIEPPKTLAALPQPTDYSKPIVLTVATGKESCVLVASDAKQLEALAQVANLAELTKAGRVVIVIETKAPATKGDDKHTGDTINVP